MSTTAQSGSVPSRRTFLTTMAALVGAVPLGRLGQWVVRYRRRHPRDLSPIPWIGHC